MIKTFKIMLLPNNKQRTKLFQYAGTARYAYNWALRKEQENHKKGRGWLSVDELKENFARLKQVEKYQWITEIPEDITNQAIEDAANAYKNFLSGVSKCPSFKNKERSQPCFYLKGTKIQFTNSHMKVEELLTNTKKSRQKCNWIRFKQHNRIPVSGTYSNPHVFYERKNWYIKVGVYEPEENSQNRNDCMNEKQKKKGKREGETTNPTAYFDKNTNKNMDKKTDKKPYVLEKIKKLEKRKRRIQRSIDRKYEKNKKGDTYYKTRNIVKKERELLKLNRQLANMHRTIQKRSKILPGC